MKIWAHRGCSYRYPENTLSSFREACRYEITGIELDIQLSRDGEMVVIHDERVDRTTHGSGRVEDMTLRELKQLKIQPNEQSSKIYETIPTMREVLALLAPVCRRDGLLINIELKNSVVRYEGMEQKILELVAEYGLEPYIVYSSFNPDSIRLLKELKPDAKVGILSRNVSNCLEFARQVPVEAIHPFIKAEDIALLSEETTGNILESETLLVRAWNTRTDEPFFPEEREIKIQDLEKLEQMGITDIFTNTPESYIPLKKVPTKRICLEKGKSIQEDTGYIQSADEECQASGRFYHVLPGDILRGNGQTEYRIYRYSLEIKGDLIHTYCYEPEQNWASYVREPDVWRRGDIVFEEECYIRVAARNNVEQSISLQLESAHDTVMEWAAYFQAEALLTIERVWELLGEDDLAFAVIADTHYVNNGTWERSAYNLQQVASRLPFNGIIHLGDLTDGILPLAQTKESVELVMGDMKQTGKPVYLCCGNHDSNYFRNNPEKMTEEEMSSYYLGREKPYYYVDYPTQKLRILYLYSFDYREQVRYGFPVEELDWVRETLETMEDGWAALVCAHVPPLPEIHFWSDQIRNGEALLRILEEYHRSGKKILAYVHGHNHGEQIYRSRLFPIVSLGCNKMEDFQDKKPAGSWTYYRQQGTVTEDLWDVMIVHADHSGIDFVRFGAGEDKKV
ncbi:MAG: hypothetical protein HDR02_01265 [Lachnospiraceae bacterium]|nr:hypothetical protein [Lachnospiraceae bacterium]